VSWTRLTANVVPSTVAEAVPPDAPAGSSLHAAPASANTATAPRAHFMVCSRGGIGRKQFKVQSSKFKVD
jgi:hypothetical protein